MTPMFDTSAVSSFVAAWQARATQVRANQPAWSSPLITTTGMLEQRVRFDVSGQHAGNGANTTVIDGGRGLDLIVSNSNEIQIAAPPYDLRNAPTRKSSFSGFGDWAFLRVKQQLASAPASSGDYFVTVWLQVQAPHRNWAVDQPRLDLFAHTRSRQGLGRFRHPGHGRCCLAGVQHRNPGGANSDQHCVPIPSVKSILARVRGKLDLLCRRSARRIEPNIS